MLSVRLRCTGMFKTMSFPLALLNVGAPGRCRSIFDVLGVVPQPDRWFRLIVFVPKYAQACSIEREELSGPRIEA